MEPEPHKPEETPSDGAHVEASHPIRGFWRGLGEVAMFFGEGVLAVLEFLTGRPPRPPRPRGRKPHPVEKTAPFPIND